MLNSSQDNRDPWKEQVMSRRKRRGAHFHDQMGHRIADTCCLLARFGGAGGEAAGCGGWDMDVAYRSGYRAVE